jgi:4-alpha-glucanotransferase
MAFQRASGILLHPTCFPSRFGIGDLGRSAYEFIDFLESSGQKLWQILPLGPTEYEHSPYTMNFSAFAGNPLMISLEQLAEEGLLDAKELIPLEGEDIKPDRVNFDRVIPYKTKYLKQAYANFKKGVVKSSWWMSDRYNTERLGNYVIMIINRRFAKNRPTNH